MAAQTSELAAIVAFVRGILAAVPGITNALSFQPVMTKPADIPAILQVGGRIAFWSVHCASTAEAWRTNLAVELTHELVIRGYAQVVEPGTASEPAFQALTGLVADALRPQYALPAPVTAELLGPLQLPVRCEHRILSDTWLCHYSEGRLRATERVTIS